MGLASRPSFARIVPLVSLVLGCSAETRVAEAPAVSAVPRSPIYADLSAAALATAELTVQETLERSLSRSTRHWRHPPSGSSGSVTPRRTFKIETGHYCREFDEVVAAAGETQSERRTACRSAAGEWIVVAP